MFGMGKKGKKKKGKKGKKGKKASSSGPFQSLGLDQPTPEFSRIHTLEAGEDDVAKGVLRQEAHEEPLIYRRAVFSSPSAAEQAKGQQRESLTSTHA